MGVSSVCVSQDSWAIVPSLGQGYLLRCMWKDRWENNFLCVQQPSLVEGPVDQTLVMQAEVVYLFIYFLPHQNLC